MAGCCPYTRYPINDDTCNQDSESKVASDGSLGLRLQFAAFGALFPKILHARWRLPRNREARSSRSKWAEGAPILCRLVPFLPIHLALSSS